MSAQPDDARGISRPDLSVIKGSALAAARARIARDPDVARRAEEAAAEESRRELLTRSRQNAWNGYARTLALVPEFAESGYPRLLPEQNPRGRVTGWWESGALNLLLVGQPGRGKTDAGYAVCNEVAAAARDGRGAVVMVRAVKVARLRDLLVHVPSPHEVRDEVASAERAREVRELRQADLLLIDDITSAKVTEAFLQAFHDLVDDRVIGHRRTIFTMNADSQAKTVDVLTETFGAAIFSRIKMRCAAVWVDGPDRRGWAREKAVEELFG